MKPAPVTPDEDQRLAKLEAYNVLDTLPEAVYDDIVSLASEICGTPIALVSLVDTDRQWFKAKVGLDAPETHRDVAFCSHAIHGDEVFEISDSRLDHRFHDNPLVTGDPHVIFYAGAPIISVEGHKVGTLCVIDNEPKTLSPTEKEMLTRLSRQVAYILEQRIVAERADALNQELRAANEELFQFSYRASQDLKAPLVSIRRLADFVRKDFGEEQYEEAIENLEKVSAMAVQLEQEVNNVLALREAGATEHASESFSVLDLLQDIAEDVEWQLEDANCDLKTSSIQDFMMHSEKARIRQILTNLISNAIKYRDPSKTPCSVEIRCPQRADRIVIQVIDNGVGIDQEHHSEVMGMFKRFHPELSEGTGLGLAIVKKHVEAMQGQIHFTSAPNVGTTFSISLPKVTQVAAA